MSTYKVTSYETLFLILFNNSYLEEPRSRSWFQSNLWWAQSSHSLSTVSFINPLRHCLVITLGCLELIHSSVVQGEWKVEGVTAAARIVWFSS